MKGLIFTYVLTYGGAAASLYRPYIGLLIYVCFSIIKPDALWHWSVPQGNYARTVAVALLVGWVLHGLGSWQLGRARLAVLGIIGFWVWIVVAGFAAPEPPVAWRIVERLSKTLLPVLVGLTLIDSVAKLKQLAWVIVLSQGYLAFEFNLIYLSGQYNPDEFKHAGMDNNSHAIAMVAAFGLAFFLGLNSRKWWGRLAAFGAAAVMAHMIMFSRSRGGMLALIISGLAIIYMMPKQPRHYLMLVVALLIGARMAGPSVWERFSTTFASKEVRDVAAEGRLQFWRGMKEAIVEHPVVGVGPGHWPLVTTRYGIEAGKSGHSTWLQTAAEFGLPAALCLMLFYGGCILKLYPMTKETENLADPWLKQIARMVVVALVGFLIAAQFVTLYGVDLPYLIGLLGMGALKLCPARESLAQANYAVKLQLAQ
jgi:probable O-glycosylation ligase (exosortase A-associated)